MQNSEENEMDRESTISNEKTLCGECSLSICLCCCYPSCSCSELDMYICINIMFGCLCGV